MTEDRELPVVPGQILAGKYRVERVLGVGGMGVVVAAHHVQLDEKVALKFLLPGMLMNAEAVGRFAREARAAVKLKNEHVARVFDVGTLETGAPYMVMELLEGGDLGAWLQERGSLPIEQAVEFVLQACVAVAEAHGMGIVHRDLKPSNLFCVRRQDGQLSIKVLDFGISKMASSTTSPPGVATRTHTVMGSPFYMSPEQMRASKGVDAATDIWALGVILYELLTRSVPFPGDSMADVAIKAATQPPPPVRQFRPDVPVALEAVIMRCLEKERAARYRNVAELALALAEFAPRRARTLVERIVGTIQAAGLSASALDMPPSPLLPDTERAPGTISPLGRTTAGGGRSTGMIAAAAAALAITGAGVFLFVRHPSGVSGGATGATGATADSIAMPIVAAVPLLAAPSAGFPAVAVLPQADSASIPEAREAPSADAAQPHAVASGHAPLRPHPETPAHPPAALGAKPPAAPPAAEPPKPNCNPPYFVDAQGNRVFKKECVK